MDNIAVTGNNNQIIVAHNINQIGSTTNTHLLDLLQTAERRNTDLLNRLCDALEDNKRLRLALAAQDLKHING